MEHRIGIFTTSPHPRIEYVAMVLCHWWGIKVEVQEANGSTCTPIAYGQSGEGLLLPMHPIMQGELFSDYDSLELNTRTEWSDTFDPLAAIFFCLSRYEEYQSVSVDRHGRFSGSKSVAYQQGWLSEPMAVRWADQLYADLRKYNPSLPPLKRTFRLMPTYDIDIAWAYRERGWRGWVRLGLDLVGGHFGRVKERLAVLFQGKQDPYDVFRLLQQTHHKVGLSAHYFWLLAHQRSRLNPNVSPHSQLLAQLLRSVSAEEANTIGIHPSYHSATQPSLITEELRQLELITGQEVKNSRQHFLRFKLSETYAALEENGIEHEHSMAYADVHGWRAGTHLPFYWYNLSLEKSTKLLIHPFPVMDATLRSYLQLSPEEGRDVLDFYYRQIRELGGPFQLLWHNSSFSKEHRWGEYGRMYLDFLLEAGNAGSMD